LAGGLEERGDIGPNGVIGGGNGGAWREAAILGHVFFNLVIVKGLASVCVFHFRLRFRLCVNTLSERLWLSLEWRV